MRDGNGEVAYQGPVVFLPQDASLRVVRRGQGPRRASRSQLGFEGCFFPTYAFSMARGPVLAVFPDARNPVMSMLAYHGDLGLDDGEPQSVYDARQGHGSTPFKKADGRPTPRLDLAAGADRATLPDGAGSSASTACSAG